MTNTIEIMKVAAGCEYMAERNRRISLDKAEGRNRWQVEKRQARVDIANETLNYWDKEHIKYSTFALIKAMLDDLEDYLAKKDKDELEAKQKVANAELSPKFNGRVFSLRSVSLVALLIIGVLGFSFFQGSSRALNTTTVAFSTKGVTPPVPVIANPSSLSYLNLKPSPIPSPPPVIKPMYTAPAPPPRPVVASRPALPPPPPPPPFQAPANYLVIPSIGFSQQVGTYGDCLGHTILSVGVYRDTCVPSGVIWLMGHNPGTFHNVPSLRPGETITYTDGSRNSRTYTIASVRSIANATLVNDGNNNSTPRLVLQTCANLSGTQDWEVTAY